MTSEEFLKKYKQHQEARRSAKEYYKEFGACLESSIEALGSSPYGYSLGPAGTVVRSKKLVELSAEFARLMTKSLGARFGDETELEKLIQDVAHQETRQATASNLFVNTLGQRISDTIIQEYELFIPNHLAVLSERLKPVKIGDVRILSLRHVEKEVKVHLLKAANPAPNRGLEFDQANAKGYLVLGASKIQIPAYRMMWAVTVKTSRVHRREEANWRVNVAISLMRLLCNKWDSRIPRPGKREPNPMVEDVFKGDSVLTRRGTSLAAGGSSMFGLYFIDADVARSLRSKKTQAICNTVFDFEPKKLSEQVFNALGWLAKGRQAEERSERLLYFFTAIEAILTREDKNSPVVDTISRHGAVALARTVKDRPTVAMLFKDLYGFRSATVHRGARTASGSTVRQAEDLAEALVATILWKCDLSQSHQAFCDSLASASYGGKWP